MLWSVCILLSELLKRGDIPTDLLHTSRQSLKFIGNSQLGVSCKAHHVILEVRLQKWWNLVADVRQVQEWLPRSRIGNSNWVRSRQSELFRWNATYSLPWQAEISNKVQINGIVGSLGTTFINDFKINICSCPNYTETALTTINCINLCPFFASIEKIVHSWAVWQESRCTKKHLNVSKNAPKRTIFGLLLWFQKLPNQGHNASEDNSAKTLVFTPSSLS